MVTTDVKKLDGGNYEISGHEATSPPSPKHIISHI